MCSAALESPLRCVLTDTGSGKSPRVTMYSSSYCGHCLRLKRQLEREGIHCEEVDIDLAANRHHGGRIVAKTGGYRTVPTLEIAGDLLVNPSIQEVRDALAGYGDE